MSQQSQQTSQRCSFLHYSYSQVPVSNRPRICRGFGEVRRLRWARALCLHSKLRRRQSRASNTEIKLKTNKEKGKKRKLQGSRKHQLNNQRLLNQGVVLSFLLIYPKAAVKRKGREPGGRRGDNAQYCSRKVWLKRCSQRQRFWGFACTFDIRVDI